MTSVSQEVGDTMKAFSQEVDALDKKVAERTASIEAHLEAMNPENRGIYTQSDSSKKSSRNIWSLAVVSVDQRY